MEKEIINVGSFRIEVSLDKSNDEGDDKVIKEKSAEEDLESIKSRVNDTTMEEMAKIISTTYGRSIDSLELVKQLALYNGLYNEIESTLEE